MDIARAILWLVCPIYRSAREECWAVIQDVFAYWGSIGYEKVTEDQHQSGGHCGFVVLSLARARLRSCYFPRHQG